MNTTPSLTPGPSRPILLSPGHALLNFYLRPFSIAVPRFHIPTVRVWSVEHYFQAMKVFYLQPPHETDQLETLDYILASDTCAGAKRLGRSLPINPELWDRAAVGHMLEAMIAKFSQHSDLRELLEATDGRPLIEHARDRIWGDGLNGSGLNLCGQCLELTRELLINGPA